MLTAYSWVLCVLCAAQCRATMTTMDNYCGSAAGLACNEVEARPIVQPVRPPPVPPRIGARHLQEAIAAALDDADRYINRSVSVDQSALSAVCHRDRPNVFISLLATGATRRLTGLYGFDERSVYERLPHVDLTGTQLETACAAANAVTMCVTSKYSRLTGECNNVQQPQWGSAQQPMARYTVPDFSDHVQATRVSGNGAPLPDASDLAVQLFKPSSSQDTDVSALFAAWFTFVHNDIAQQADLFGKPLTLSNTRRAAPAAANKCALGVENPANVATAYIDASHIYGSSYDEALQNSIRTFSRGRLGLDADVNSEKGRLPTVKSNAACQVCEGAECFVSGSSLVNESPAQAALHTVWLRQHNRIAQQLQALNSQWNDELLYQEARRIVIAQIQHITYNEFLPTLIGCEALVSYALSLQPSGSYFAQYDIRTYVAPAVEAYGCLHQALQPAALKLYPKPENSAGRSLQFDQFYLNPRLLLHNVSNVDSVLRWLLRDGIMAGRLQVPDHRLAQQCIQRGRDQGVPSWTAVRAACGLSVPASWDALVPHFNGDRALVERLRTTYNSMADVDLIVGLLAESTVRGGVFGPTASCLLAAQFKRLREGDRYWYENFFVQTAFTEAQLAAIRDTSLARVLCDNTDDLGLIQPKALLRDDQFENCPLSCDNAMLGGTIDLAAWKDREPTVTVLPVSPEVLRKAAQLAGQERSAKVAKELELMQLRESMPDGTPRSMLTPTDHAVDIAITSSLFLQMTSVLMKSARGRLPDLALDRLLEFGPEALLELLPHIDVDSFIEDITEGPMPHSECVPRTECDESSPYRTLSGWCNNRQYREYGNAFQPYRRLLPPAYNDGFNEPRQLGTNGQPLPSARLISNMVHSIQGKPSVKFSSMTMQWGQFLDHDLTLSPTAAGPGGRHLNCKSCDATERESENCLPIHVPADDPDFPQTNEDGSRFCLPFTRSLVGQMKLGYRNQLNQVSAFIDGSNLYGSDECTAKTLRYHSGGLLNFTAGFDGTPHSQFLPQGVPAQEPTCHSAAVHSCFRAGDIRANEHAGLASMHTIFLRAHNGWATELQRVNPHWDDQKLYQETRRIVGAVMQHITFNEFVPKVLGYSLASQFDLVPLGSGYYKGYDVTCDATLSNSFAAAAYRFGHSLITGTFPMADGGPDLTLQDMFFNVSSVYLELERVLNAMIHTPSQSLDVSISESIRVHLFEQRGKAHSGEDLAARNIQRGRDHGIPPYTKFREYCHQPQTRGWPDLLQVIEPDVVKALRRVYDHVDDIDLFTGLMSERPLRGALVGQTTACLLAEQFRRLKKCDRFFYENDDPVSRFTEQQLSEIRKLSLSKVVCDNSRGMQSVPASAFDMVDRIKNVDMPCDSLPSLDLTKWTDVRRCHINEHVLAVGQPVNISPCVACVCTKQGLNCHNLRVKCNTLLNRFPLDELRNDVSCIIQCPRQIGLGRAVQQV